MSAWSSRTPASMRSCLSAPGGGRGGALLLTRWGDAVTTETHKLAAILAADVVGFSRRRRRGAYARAAESAACRILQARLLRRPLSREDGGRLFQAGLQK